MIYKKKTENPLEWLRQRNWNFLKIFCIHHFPAVMVGRARMTPLSPGTHLAGINVIVGLIQILIVLILMDWGNISKQTTKREKERKREREG